MLIYALCKDTLQCRILKNYELKECERRRSWPVWDTSPENNWRDWGKPLNSLLSVVDIPAAIQTGYVIKTPTVRTIICSSPLIIVKTEVMEKVARIIQMKAHSESRPTALIIRNVGAVSGWVVSAMPGSLYHGKRAPVSTVEEDVWAPQPVWRRENLLPPRDLNPEPSSCVVSRYTDYTVPAPGIELGHTITQCWTYAKGVRSSMPPQHRSYCDPQGLTSACKSSCNTV